MVFSKVDFGFDWFLFCMKFYSSCALGDLFLLLYAFNIFILPIKIITIYSLFLEIHVQVLLFDLNFEARKIET